MENEQGVVVKSTGKWCEVLSEDGEIIDCQIRGKFRNEGIRTTNPVAVGDKVTFSVGEDGTGVVSEIHDRKNYIVRKSVNLSKHAHIVASNIDRAFLVVTLTQPPTSTGFIDRFLVTADAYGVPVTILFNKVDIYDQKAEEELAYYEYIYKSCGFPCFEISAKTGQGIAEVREVMKDHINLVSGHSGVGKSTLINRLIPGADIKIGEVSRFHHKGQHTTTFAEMHRLPDGGFIIDTPGIKGFGLVDLNKDELHHHFPEMFALLPECRFHNCKHVNEPGCAVQEAIEQGELPEERYVNYRAMLEEEEGYR